MASGDPRFGHTFGKLRGTLVEEVVTKNEACNWSCRLCKATWDGDTSQLKAGFHEESCVLSRFRDDEEYP